MRGRVLIVAGSDCGGGAGMQADIKSVTALGAYAESALTAITVQDTFGVHAVHPVPPAVIAAQMECVLNDPGVDAIKCGMIGGAEALEAVAAVITARAAGLPVVIDPVMVAKGGASLMAADALAPMRARLLPLASVLTPNIPEAEALLGRRIAGEAEMAAAAADLRAMGPKAVLLKGGHLEGTEVVDVLASAAGTTFWRAARIVTRHTHGTGCTLASALAAGLAQGLSVIEAAGRAHAYVHAAIRTAPGFGGGHGPLNHAVTVDPGRIATLG